MEVTQIGAVARESLAEAHLERARQNVVRRGAQGIDRSSAAWKAAQDFEAQVLSQMFEMMFAGLRADGPLGGGHAERTYRSFLLQAYGESVAENGTTGIAEQIYRDIQKHYATAGTPSGGDHG